MSGLKMLAPLEQPDLMYSLDPLTRGDDLKAMEEAMINYRPIVGMLVAVELDAVIEKYGDRLKEVENSAFDISFVAEENYDLYIINSGAGEIAAAATVQLLISEYHADMIVNFGVVGGLTPEMKVAKLGVVEKVVHYDFDISDFAGRKKAQYPDYSSAYIPTDEALLHAAMELLPGLKPVICASGDKFIADAAKKRALNDEFGADICEMEAAGIVLTCNRNGIPCLLIKAVSDAMEGGAEEFNRELDRCAMISLETLDAIITKYFMQKE